ncbi:hypothetical protein CMUS01_16307 [Colletotrichum musicola]|uniref:DUF6604 domain-containing protein n=1 Tax=Colletotrichum musicola TaxID=2175873 RepID=A0A8H6IPE3_9PEZI|nr:hypothetical protein CMUS01_16307 [Colletotrichum musicola]
MPKKHRRYLKEAVSLRRRVADRFRGAGCEESNATHAFFIETLETILEHFNAAKILEVTAGQVQQPQKSSETPENNGGRNYFAILGGKSRAAPSADNGEADDNEGDSKFGLPHAMEKDASGDTAPNSNKVESSKA